MSDAYEIVDELLERIKSLEAEIARDSMTREECIAISRALDSRHEYHDPAYVSAVRRVKGRLDRIEFERAESERRERSGLIESLTDEECQIILDRRAVGTRDERSR